MRVQRAILVNGSRLMRDLIKRVLEKNAGFEVVRELSDVQELPSAITDTNVEWVFVTLALNQKISERLKIKLFLNHPGLRIIGLWVEGSHVKMEWLIREEKDLTGITLDKLTHLLRQELHVLQDTLEAAGEEECK